jgi:branched-chain amino acid transport system ATP-binding protein
MLQVSELVTGYGKKEVLHGISLEVTSGEIVTLIGPNGAGKSTALKAIFGLTKVERGYVLFKGEQIQNRRPSLHVRAGLNYVPQGGRVFTELTVLENLEVGGYILESREEFKDRVEQVFQLFPALKDRRNLVAGRLSGGERQMLALGRALILKPDLLLLDEPSLGLSPKLAKTAIRTIKEINEKLKTTVLMVEQNVREALSIANRVYLLKLGRIALHDTASNLLNKERLGEIFLS